MTQIDRRAAAALALLGPLAIAAGVRAQPGTAAAPARAAAGKKTVGVILYPDFEVLDVFGPVEMWAYAPDLRIVLIAEAAGSVRSAQGVSALAEFGFANAPAMDIMMVPGGNGTRVQLNNAAYIKFLQDTDKTTTLTTSVCTGSALLAKAGLLKGKRATSNKTYFSLAVQQDSSVDWVKKARWVEDGKYITSSGVSAGTDMALGVLARLYGKPAAAQLARTLEYVWNDDSTNDPFAIA